MARTLKPSKRKLRDLQVRGSVMNYLKSVQCSVDDLKFLTQYPEKKIREALDYFVERGLVVREGFGVGVSPYRHTFVGGGGDNGEGTSEPEQGQEDTQRGEGQWSAAILEAKEVLRKNSGWGQDREQGG